MSAAYGGDGSDESLSLIVMTAGESCDGLACEHLTVFEDAGSLC